MNKLQANGVRAVQSDVRLTHGRWATARVARGWERVPARGVVGERDVGDHEGPLHSPRHSRPYGIRWVFLRLMPIALSTYS